MRLAPNDRPSLQVKPLVASLEVHDVRWVLCGSYVLSLYGADIEANDLDVVPALDPENLRCVAACLRSLQAVPAYLGDFKPLDTIEACLDWTTEPEDAVNLDWLFVTEFGMLDIVIRYAAPYPELMADAAWIDGEALWACHPRHVLRALAQRQRKKDLDRRAVYEKMRERFGLPPLGNADGV